MNWIVDAHHHLWDLDVTPQAWLDDLRKAPVADLGISAAEVLDQLYTDGEL